MSSNLSLAKRRRDRVRVRIKRNAKGKVRFSVFRSSRHIYVQLIDDKVGNTLTSASSLEKDEKLLADSKNGIDVAVSVGKMIASRAKEVGINEVVFDRGSY